MAVEKWPVEAGQIMLFARAVADPNPIYSDEDYAKKTEAGGIIAPPTFERSSAQYDPDYVLRPKVGQPWFGSGKEATGTPSGGAGGRGGSKEGGTGLHAEQHFEYHRHLRPGDVLTAKDRPGKTWEKEGRRAGKMSFSESITDYYDQDGQLVLTARSVGVRTSRVVSQD